MGWIGLGFGFSSKDDIRPVHRAAVNPLQPIMDWLSAQPAVCRVLPLDGEARDVLFEKEAGTKTSVGIPLVNESLESAKKRRWNVAAVTKPDVMLPLHIDSSIIMRNGRGETIGYEVHSQEVRDRLDSEGNVVWMSSDFAVELDADMEGLAFVLREARFPLMEEETDAVDVSVMFPSVGTILAMSNFTEDITRNESLIVISFDL